MTTRKALQPVAVGQVIDERPPLALGAAPLGSLFTFVSSEDAQATVDAAWDAGVRSFDVAPM